VDRWIQIAERISTRIRIGDLVSQCTWGHMCQSHFGMLKLYSSFISHEDRMRFGDQEMSES